MNRKERRAAGKQAHKSGQQRQDAEMQGLGSPTIPTVKPSAAHMVEIGYRLHQAGQLADAERAYQSVLASEPGHLAALQLQGALAHQTGRHELAVELIGRALKQDDRIAELHYNIAAPLQALGRAQEAITYYSHALRLKPDFAEAHFELGNAFAKQDRLHDAVEHWRQAATLQPANPAAPLNIGIALRRQGQLDAATAQFKEILARHPNYAEAHHQLAVLLQQQGRRTEAAAGYRRALELKSDFAEAAVLLGNLLLADGQVAEALRTARRALAIAETSRTKALFVQCANAATPDIDLDNVRDLLLRALTETWIRPSDLATACTRLIRLHDAGASGLAAAAAEPLLQALLTSTRVADAGLERILTGLRRAVLAASDSSLPDTLLAFASALAQQCFINEYVFAVDEAEFAQAEALRDKLIAALSTRQVSAPLLIAVACYVPLHKVPGAERLLKLRWPQPVHALLALQVQGPLEEQALRAQIPALTPIGTGVSTQVRGQYEENPYPRWAKTSPSPVGEPTTIDGFLRTRFPLAEFVDLGRRDIDVLVAGCGTGQYTIEFVRQFKSATVQAIDLSLASLAHARRQAAHYGVAISFAQADIMRLPDLGRTFDMIESSGVMHHTADPLAAWRALLSLLRPGGVMLVGLYSERARADIVAAQNFIRERGYRPTEPDIRRARQDLLAAPDGTALKNVSLFGDFFSMSECRDLLFHVQEHRFTLPDIKAFVTENNLAFLGFELDGQVLRRYGAGNPADRAMTDLDRWHAFEQENPGTFVGMYRFWVQKKR